VGMPSKQPRIAVTADTELIDALDRVRVATGTREANATLVRRLAVEGANAELQARVERRAAAEAMFKLMDRGGFALDLGAIDQLNEPDPATR
jgi:DNA-binding transcriptional regulator LsrR (DeoR family)